MKSRRRITARSIVDDAIRPAVAAASSASMAFAGNEALARAYADGAAEMKVHAGPIEDVVVAPADPEEAVLDLQEVDETELDRRVEGLLALKKRLGLFTERITNQSGAEKVVGAPSHREAADRMANVVRQLRIR